MVCFLTFGLYMLYAPFVEDSDDQLQQLAQVQIFFSLVASIGLRMTPPDRTLEMIVSVCFFIIPIFAFVAETEIADQVRGAYSLFKRFSSKKIMAGARRLARAMGLYTPEVTVVPAPPKAEAGPDEISRGMG